MPSSEKFWTCCRKLCMWIIYFCPYKKEFCFVYKVLGWYNEYIQVCREEKNYIQCTEDKYHNKCQQSIRQQEDKEQQYQLQQKFHEISIKLPETICKSAIKCQWAVGDDRILILLIPTKFRFLGLKYSGRNFLCPIYFFYELHSTPIINRQWLINP